MRYDRWRYACNAYGKLEYRLRRPRRRAIPDTDQRLRLRAWFKQIVAFSRHFRTVTFDIRGKRDLRNSVAELTAEVVALQDHLGIRKTHALGTSLGGFVAQELVLERPDLVDR